MIETHDASTSTLVTAVEVKSGHGIFMNQRELPPMRPHDVEIAPLFSFVSAGTELAVLNIVRSAAPGEQPINRLGYSQCGVITKVGEAVQGLEEGDRVIAIGAGAFHATRTIIAQNLVTLLPESVCPKQAAMAAMFCFSLEGVRKSSVRFGENVVVLGGGTMGQIALRLYRLSGARVAMMEGNAYRRGYLPEGIPAFSSDEAGWRELASWAAPYGIEHACICFGGDASATVDALRGVMSRGPDGVAHGRLVFPGGAKICVTMANNMGNIQLLSSSKAGAGYRDPHYESGADYPSAYVQHPVRRNVEVLLTLLQSGELTLGDLITHTFPFPEAEKAYVMLEQPNVEAMAVLLDYKNTATALS